MPRRLLALTIAATSAATGLAAGALLARRPALPPPATERTPRYYRDPMNPSRTSPVPRKDEMGMDYVPVFEGAPAEATGQRAVHVEPRMAQRSGVREEPARVRSLSREIRTVGHVTYDERRLFDVNAKFSGWIEKLHADYTGKAVRRGEPLMEVYSPELVSTQQDYLLALRARAALAPNALPELRAQAEALVSSARRRLEWFDVGDRELARLARRGVASKTLTLRAPTDGYVVEKAVVQGTQVVPGTRLLRVADPSSVWVLADVYEYELPWIAAGQDAVVELPYAPGTSLLGRITFVSPVLAGDTRTVKVRVEVQNGGGRVLLRPDMYATVVIRSPIAREALTIPEQAVLRTGERNVAIVALGDGWFEPREVVLGAAAESYVEVLDGLQDGERVVTSSQFLIDSESNLRSAVAAMSAPEKSAPPDDHAQR